MSTPACCLGERLLHQHLHRGVVDDVVVVIQQTVLAVAGEGVERHIGHHAQIGKLFFQRAHHVGYQAIGVGGLDAIGRFQVLADDREQCHHRDAQLHTVFGHGQQQIQAQAFDPGHGTHGLSAALAFEHEHRVDQVMRRHGVLAHEVAGESVAAQAAWTCGRVGWELGRHVHGVDCGKLAARWPWHCFAAAAPVSPLYLRKITKTLWFGYVEAATSRKNRVKIVTEWSRDCFPLFLPERVPWSVTA
jgi:hypothetical protein